MIEKRGFEAVEYARTYGLGFLIDEQSLTNAESRIRGRAASINDINDLLEQETGEEYDRTRVFEGSATFRFFIDRYGDGWIYVPLEGNYPLEEEQAVLQLFNKILAGERPCSGGDIMEIASENPPQLQDTGFPPVADVDLLFHAALRLVDKGFLEAYRDPKHLQKTVSRNYGNTSFLLPANLQISLSDLLCEECTASLRSSPTNLHRQCAHRLAKRLTESLGEDSEAHEKTPS